DGVVGRLELLDPPVAEYAGLGRPLVPATPNVLELVRVAPAVVLQVAPQLLWQPRVVRPIGLHHNGVRRRMRPTQERIHRIRRLARVPAKPQLRAGLAERRDRKSVVKGTRGDS